ncbi:MAG TPA: lipopolysaccharide biosynthesis protein, partial [Bacteroidota bacterium]|nr:lipopolysaccharide biosynthesis protein [Bacteroidota bacterium]
MPGDAIGELKEKTFHGTMVMGGVNIALRVITMVSSVLLMRVLDVDDFGIVGAAMIVLYTTNLFAGLGLTFALIQSQAPRGQVAFQSFVVTSSAGAVLCLLILANINPLAALLGKAEIAPILAWLAPLVFIGGLAMVPEALLQKQMLFNRMSVVVIAGELTYVGLALAFAYSGFGIWSLVYAALTKSVLILVLDWILTPGWEWITPKPWDGKLMKKLLSFGLQSTGGGVTTFIYSLIDNFTVTRWLGTTQLSYYQKSFDFTSRTVDGLNNVISSVLLPSYALIQSERERLSRAYLKSLRLISFIIVPVAMGMLIMAPEMVMTFLTDKWSPMVVPFQILCVVSMVKPLSATTSVLFTSVGHPGYNFRAGLVVIAVLVPMIVLLLPYGIVGVAFAVLTAQVVGFAYNMFQVTRILRNTASRMPAAIAPSLLAAGLMMVAVALIKAPVQSLAGGAHTPWSGAGLIVVGGGVYMTTLALI